MATNSSAENYIAIHKCECPNRYDEQPPITLGVVHAPDNKNSKESFAWKMYKKMCWGSDGKGRHMRKTDIKFVEVSPAESPARKTCTGHYDEGYPIIKLEKEYEKLIILQRLHKKTGDWRNPECRKTHAVIMIYGRRQEKKANRDPISSEFAYMQKGCLIYR